VTFQLDADDTGKLTLLSVTASFKYRRYGGYNSGEDERLKGTFTTRIDMRNQKLS
jgi:hypothetical protein